MKVFYIDFKEMYEIVLITTKFIHKNAFKKKNSKTLI